MIADLVRKLGAAGCTIEQIAVAVEMAEQEANEKQQKRRRAAADRQARWRDKRHVTSVGVTECDVTEQVSPLSPSPSSPLLPPNNPLPLSPLPLSSTVADATRRTIDSDFQEFWKAYPKRDGANPKAPARKAFLAALKAGTEASEITEGARRCSARDRDKIGTPFIPQAVKWLRDRRWEDYGATGPPAAAGYQPPPGAVSFIDKMKEKSNGHANGTGIRENTGLGEVRPDQPPELFVPR